MKKFLSLVLALVMTMSLVTVSAGAKDFTDDSKINYDEAVAVMSTLGVVGGYADGSFNPGTTLTRGAAAKIICNVILGTTTANALVAKTAPYSDVPANHTFAGYIAYCQKEGIISGYADGTFKPANTLTGYAFMKMLLGALGLDAEVEGYTGPNWSISVAKRALSDSVDLADGLKGDFNGVKAVTREEACLYAFNMIQAKKFSYDNSSTIVVGNITVKNNSKATQDGNDVYYKNVFTKLKGYDNQFDDMQRPATMWKYDGKEIGTYAKTPDATYTAKVKSKDLYADLDLSEDVDSADVKYYVDGKVAANSFDITKDGADKKEKFGEGDGVVLEAYIIENTDGTVKNVVLTAINTYFDEITDVDKNDAKERIVKIGSLEYVTSQFEEDDKVIYTKNVTANDEDQIQTMAKVEKKTGTLTKTVDNEYTIGGTTYTLNNNVSDARDYKVKDDVDFYLDANGYIIAIEASDDEVKVDNLAYVLKSDNDRTDYAKLLFADGTTKIVDTDESYDALVGHIVSFKVDKNGDYELTDRSENNSRGTVNTVDVKGKNGVDNKVVSNAAFTKENTKLTLTTTTSTDKGYVTTDSKTVFVYATMDGTDTDYTVYTGFRKAPTVAAGDIKAVAAYVKSGDKAATMVVIMADKDDVTNSSDLTFIAAKDDAKVIDDGDNTYYEFQAVEDGKIVTIKVNTTTGATIAAGDKVAVYKTVNYNSDDIMKDTSSTATVNTDYKTATTAGKEKNDTITLGGSALGYTEGVKVFFVDDGKITEGKLSDIREDNDGSKNPYDSICYTLDDGDVDMIVLVKK